VEHNSEVARALDDRDGGREHRNVVDDVNVLQLLAGAEPDDLRLGRLTMIFSEITEKECVIEKYRALDSENLHCATLRSHLSKS